MKETKQNACSCICVCKDLDTLSTACWSVSHVIVQVKQSSSLFFTWTICVPYLKNKGKEKTYDNHDMFLAQEVRRLATMFGSQAKTEQKTGGLLTKPSKQV